MNKQELIQLRNKLPRKSYQRIADSTGKSYRSVIEVLRGTFNNDDIIDEAYRIAKEHQSRLKSRQL
jgi:hypothetical protein